MKNPFHRCIKVALAAVLPFGALATPASAQVSLPFPRPPSASVAGPSLAESRH